MAATITKGYTFGASEYVTNTKIHTAIDSATISGISGSEINLSELVFIDDDIVSIDDEIVYYV